MSGFRCQEKWGRRQRAKIGVRCQVSGVRKSGAEDRGQKTEVRRQMTEDPSSPDGFAAARRGQKIDNRGRNAIKKG